MKNIDGLLENDLSPKEENLDFIEAYVTFSDFCGCNVTLDDDRGSFSHQNSKSARVQMMIEKEKFKKAGVVCWASTLPGQEDGGNHGVLCPLGYGMKWQNAI